MGKKSLIVVVGPTASGKTAAAIAMAKAFNAEILSADSRQFYKEIPIGTAAPSPEELAQAKHHFIGNLSIKEHWSAGEYEQAALQQLKSIYNCHDLAIVCGGSGLFIDALCNGLDDFPKVSEELRNELVSKYEAEGLQWLQAQVRDADPDFYKQVDSHNPRRLLRALEVYKASGKPFSFFRKNKKKSRDFEVHKIGLQWDRAELYERINQRVHAMIAMGLEEEVRSVQSFKDHQALQTVGYQEWFPHFDGAYDKNTLIEKIKQNSRRYAKRQTTWFKRDKSTFWVKPQALDEAIQELKSRGLNCNK